VAKCDEGYLCEVCGGDVATLSESDLYLRYVIGLLDPEVLHTTPERHVRCNPALAQYIIAGGFPPVECLGAFDKRLLDSEFVSEREALVTRGYLRLRELEGAGEAIINYPLPEVLERIKQRSATT